MVIPQGVDIVMGNFWKEKHAFGIYRHVITKLSFFHFLLVFNGVMTLRLQGCLETLQKKPLPFLSKLFSDKLSLSSFILVIYIYIYILMYIAFSYCSWGSKGKNTEVVCHSLLQWTTVCQTSPPWPVHLGWSHTAWLFHWVRQGCGPVIRLASFLWLWFWCVCPLMRSHNAYHLTWISLTLDVGYHFTAAPAKGSHCSLPWMRGIFSQLPLLTLNVE